MQQICICSITALRGSIQAVKGREPAEMLINCRDQQVQLVETLDKW